MSGYDSWEIRLAWQIARQVRGCPPDGEVLAESPDENLVEHLKVCAFCQDLRRTGASASEEFELARRLPQTLEAKWAPSMAEGQVRSLREALAGWGPRKLFYNPPLVLILVAASEVGDAVRVAQVYDDPRLMGPGDIPIGKDLFAETWNTYTLRGSYLDRLITTVPKETLQAVLDLEAKEVPPLNEYTQLKAFRRLEIEVGAFFSIQAVSELMCEHQPDLGECLVTAFPQDQSVLDEIRRSNPRIAWFPGKRPLLEALALARFPEDEIPLAASSRQKIVPVNVLKIHPETQEVSFSPAIAVISVWREDQGGLLTGGQIEAELMTEVELSAHLELPDGSLRKAVQTFLEAGTGHFRAFFSNIDATLVPNCRLLLLVLTR